MTKPNTTTTPATTSTEDQTLTQLAASTTSEMDLTVTPPPAPRAQVAPSKTDANASTHPFCCCGCGTRVATATASWLSGHDARCASQVAKLAAQTPDPARYVAMMLPGHPKLATKATEQALRLAASRPTGTARVTLTATERFELAKAELAKLEAAAKAEQAS